jgi:signal transduction histidine kinase
MASTSRELAILDLIVHELRTPLSVAAGSLAQVSEGSAFTPAQQSAAERVERSLKTLTALTDQLRAWSRASDTTPRSPVNLAAALAPALESADGRRRGIDLVRPEVPADIKIMSVGDLFIPALTSIVAAVVRSAPNRSTVQIQVTFDDREVRILVGEVSSASELEFPAEFVGGLGFSLPLAKAAIEIAGGRIWSNGPDGRIAGIGVVMPRA